MPSAHYNDFTNRFPKTIARIERFAADCYGKEAIYAPALKNFCAELGTGTAVILEAFDRFSSDSLSESEGRCDFGEGANEIRDLWKEESEAEAVVLRKQADDEAKAVEATNELRNTTIVEKARGGASFSDLCSEHRKDDVLRALGLAGLQFVDGKILSVEEARQARQAKYLPSHTETPQTIPTDTAPTYAARRSVYRAARRQPSAIAKLRTVPTVRGEAADSSAPEEVWLRSKDVPDYIVSNHYRVANRTTGKILKPEGYRGKIFVRPRVGGKQLKRNPVWLWEHARNDGGL